MRPHTRSPLVMAMAALVATTAVVLSAPRDARACKPDGKQCATNVSCCSGHCIKPTVQHGKALFGICCTPTTCAAQGASCGTIPDGDCSGFFLDCGTCTAPQTCGGGGTANVCGCTPTTCAAQGATCGTISDGCGGTLDCGTCTSPDTCGGGGIPNRCGCTRMTCTTALPNCGTLSDGCGGTLDCTCNFCGCCCADTLHPGQCISSGGGGLCTTVTGGYFTPPGNCDPFICALVCAGFCDSVLSTTYVSSSCEAVFFCPPYCGDVGTSCGQDTDCCSAFFCVAGRCATCVPAGDPCRAGAGCCAGLSCSVGGVCS